MKIYSSDYSLERAFLSDPQHMIFIYEPNNPHIRLVQLERLRQNHLNAHSSNLYPFQSITVNNNSIQQGHQFLFAPKKCFMMDHHLTVIQKIISGLPLNYKIHYQQSYKQFLKERIFIWYNGKERYMICGNDQNKFQRRTRNAYTQSPKQYLSYPQIDNFCFGRKHFVRSINAMDIASDLISRDHCRLVVIKQENSSNQNHVLFQKGQQQSKCLKQQINLSKQQKTREFVKKIFGQSTQTRKSRNKSSQWQMMTFQLWVKIYSYLYQQNHQKYYLVDSGSRNGTFFIQKPRRQVLDKQQIQFQQINKTLPTNLCIKHALSLKHGYSYEYEGEQYKIKVLKLSQKVETGGLKMPSIKTIKCEQRLSQSQLDNNLRIVNFIRQYCQEVSRWQNNFQKVIKQYVVDEELLKWKKQLQQKDTEQDLLFSTQDLLKRLVFEGQRIDELLSSIQPSEKGFQNNNNQRFYEPDFNGNCQYQSYQSCQSLVSPMQLVNSEQAKIFTSEIIKKLPQSEYLMLNTRLHLLTLELEFPNDYRKLYCLLTTQSNKKRFYIGPNMLINTSRYIQMNQNQYWGFEYDLNYYYELYNNENKSGGFIQWDGDKWKIYAIGKKISSSTNIKKNISSKKKIKDDSSESEQSDSGYQYNPLFTVPSPSKTSTQPQYVVNLKSQICNHIWTKVPTSHAEQINPRKCDNYLLRLSHSFYFELKFINYSKNKNEQI